LETSDRGSEDIMGSLTEKAEIRLSKEDAALLSYTFSAEVDLEP